MSHSIPYNGLTPTDRVSYLQPSQRSPWHIQSTSVGAEELGELVKRIYADSHPASPSVVWPDLIGKRHVRDFLSKHPEPRRDSSFEGLKFRSQAALDKAALQHPDLMSLDEAAAQKIFQFCILQANCFYLSEFSERHIAFAARTSDFSISTYNGLCRAVPELFPAMCNAAVSARMGIGKGRELAVLLSDQLIKLGIYNTIVFGYKDRVLDGHTVVVIGRPRDPFNPEPEKLGASSEISSFFLEESVVYDPELRELSSAAQFAASRSMEYMKDLLGPSVQFLPFLASFALRQAADHLFKWKTPAELNTVKEIVIGRLVDTLPDDWLTGRTTAENAFTFTRYAQWAESLIKARKQLIASMEGWAKSLQSDPRVRGLQPSANPPIPQTLRRILDRTQASTAGPST